MAMLSELLRLRERTIYHVGGQEPAVFFLIDRSAGGVLINAPAFDPSLLVELQSLAPLRYIYLPSRYGEQDLDQWRDAAGAEVLAHEVEARALQGHVDIPIDHKSKFTRTISFLPMAGATAGSCALRLRNQPGVIFFGPALSTGDDGWPTLVLRDRDHSQESRLFGALGLQDLSFEYAFTDDFDPTRSRFGPGAGEAVKRHVEAILNE